MCVGLHNGFLKQQGRQQQKQRWCDATPSKLPGVHVHEPSRRDDRSNPSEPRAKLLSSAQPADSPSIPQDRNTTPAHRHMSKPELRGAQPKLDELGRQASQSTAGRWSAQTPPHKTASAFQSKILQTQCYQKMKPRGSLEQCSEGCDRFSHGRSGYSLASFIHARWK